MRAYFYLLEVNMADQMFTMGWDADFSTLESALTRLNSKISNSFNDRVINAFVRELNAAETSANKFEIGINRVLQRFNSLTVTQQAWVRAASSSDVEILKLISGFDRMTAAADRAARAEQAALDARNRRSRQGMYEDLFGRGGTQDTLIQRSARPSASEWNRMTANRFGPAAQPSSAKESASIFAGLQPNSMGLFTTNAQKANTQLVTMGNNFGRLSGIQDTFWGKAIGRFGMHLAQWSAWLLLIDAAQQGIEAVAHTMSEAISRSAEFQVQGVQFQAAEKSGRAQGIISGPGVSTNQVLQDSIKLATQYGDKVSDVSQDIQLWYKRTGDLNAALFMTNEGLKFQLATGTDLEDFYRTITALSSQMGNIPLTSKDKMGFDLTQTPRLMNMIVAASQSMGAGFHQVNREGKELGSGTANAAYILLHALEQDASALGTLGLKGDQIIAVNQALITSFGNTGMAAGEAGERVARLAGGIASLNKPASVNALVKGGFSEAQIKGLQAVFDTSKGGDVFERYGKYMATLDKPLREILELQISGTRQWETTTNVLRAYEQNVQRIRKAMQDQNAETRLASDMSNTYEINVRKLQGAWDGFLITFGLGVLPSLTTFVKYVTTDVIPAIGLMIDGLGRWARLSAALNDIGAAGRRDWEGVKQSARGFGELRDVERESRLTQEQASSGPVTRRGTTEAQERALYDAEVRRKREELGSMAVYRPAPFKFKPDYPSELARRHDLSPQSFARNTPNAENVVTAQNIAFAGQKGIADAVELNRRAQEALKHIGGQHPEAGGRGVADPTTAAKKQKGVASASQEARTALEQLKQSYTDLTDAQRNHQLIDQEEVRMAERKVRIYGANDDTVAAAKAAMRKESADYQREINIAQRDLPLAQKIANADYRKAMAAKPGSTTRDQMLGAYRQARSFVDELTLAITRARNAQVDLNDRAQELDLKKIEDWYTRAMTTRDKDVTNAQNVFSEAENQGAKRAALPNLLTQIQASRDLASDQVKRLTSSQWWHGDWDNQTPEEFSRQYDAAMATIQQRDQEAINAKKQLKQAQDQLIESLSKGAASGRQGLEDSLLGAAGFANSSGGAAQETYYRAIFKTQRDLVDQTEAWKQKIREIGTATDDVSNYQRDLANRAFDYAKAMDSVNLSLAEQQRRIDTIKNSDFFKAVDQALGTVAGNLSSNFMNAFTGLNSSNNRINQLNEETQAMETQKQAANDLYSLQKNHTAEQDAMHQIYMRDMDLQIAKTKALTEAEKQRQQNPGGLKKVADDFVKSMVDGFINKLKTDALNGLFNLDPNKDLKESMKLYADVTKNQLVKALGSSEDGFASSVVSFKSAAATFSEAVGALLRAMPTAPANLNTPSQSDANIIQNVLNVFANPGADSTTGNTLFNQNNSAGSSISPAVAAAMGISMGGGFQVASTSLNGLGSPSGAVGGVNSSDAVTLAAATGISYPQAVAVLNQSQAQMSMDPLGARTAKPGGVTGIGMGIQDYLKIPKGGIGTGPGSLGKYANIATAAYGLYSAATQTKGNGTVGGFSSGVQGAVSGAKLGSIFGPVGTAVGAAAGFLIGLIGFGNHTPSDQMPDKFDTARFTQYVGELQGSAATAYGPPYNPATDPVQQQLGGQPMLNYIQAWVAKNLNSGNSDKKKLAQRLDALYGHIPGQGLGFQKDIGKEWVKGGSLSGTYVDIWNQAMTDVQDILTLDNANAQPEQLVGLNQYGSGTGFFAYSWDTPGYNAPSTPPGTAGGSTLVPGGSGPVIPGTGTGSTTTGSGGTGGITIGGGGGRITPPQIDQSPAAYAYNIPTYSATAAPIVVQQNITIPVDGRVLARTNQAYALRAAAQGYESVT
jgi:hypothetical protein